MSIAPLFSSRFRPHAQDQLVLHKTPLYYIKSGIRLTANDSIVPGFSLRPNLW